jgi:MFS family permease
MTDSPWLVALVGVFSMAPLLVLSLVGGVVADRLNRQRVYAATQAANLVAAATMTTLLFIGPVQVWYAYLTMLVVGIAWALDFPARRSLIQDFLGRGGLTNGIALDSVAMHGSKMVGPALAGALISLVDVKGGYVMVTMFYMLSVALLWSFRAPPRVSIAVQQNPFRNLVEGLKYVRSNRTILAVLIITVLMNLLLFSYMQMVPVIARDMLHVGPGLVGVLMSADGIGAFTGALIVASVPRLRHHAYLYWGGSMLALTMLLAFSLSRAYTLSFPLLLVMGLGEAGFATMQSTMIMLVAKEEMRGRVLGVLSLAIGAGPVGSLVVGAVADEYSPTFAIGVNACIGLVLVGVVWMLMPSLRHPITVEERG